MSSNSVVNRVPEQSNIKSIEFNQDYSCLCVGTKTGWSLVNVLTDPIKESFSQNVESMSCVGRLFISSLVTLVSVNDMRKLNVYHSKRKHVICTYRYPKSILTIKLNRKRLVVCVEDTIFIHNILDMSLVHKIEETPSNRNGVIALSPNDENCYLAFPGLAKGGTVFVFDCNNFRSVNSIMAHDGVLAALEFNSSGNLLATASEKGTVIRVFSIPNGSKLMEFRRGIARSAQICSLSFSKNNAFLVVASNTTTIHVFKLDSRNKSDDSANKGRIRTVSGTSLNTNDIADEINFVQSSEDPTKNTYGASPGRFTTSTVSNSQSWSWTEGIYGWVSGMIMASADYMPAQVAEVLQQDRSFVTAHLPSPVVPSGLSEDPGNFFNSRKIAAIQYVQNNLQLLVACMDGWLYSFSFDSVNGGEATFIKQQCFIGNRVTSDVANVRDTPSTGTNLRTAGGSCTTELPPGVGVMQRISQNGTQNQGSFAGVVAPVSQADFHTSSGNPSPNVDMQPSSQAPLVSLYDLAQGEVLSSTPPDLHGLALHDHNEYPPINKS